MNAKEMQPLLKHVYHQLKQILVGDHRYQRNPKPHRGMPIPCDHHLFLSPIRSRTNHQNNSNLQEHTMQPSD